MATPILHEIPSPTLHKVTQQTLTRRALLLLAVALSGCATTGQPITAEQLAHLERNVTTYAEVVALLGPPTSTTVRADGSRQAVYRVTRTDQRVENVLPVVSLFAGHGTLHSTTLTVDFDSRGVVSTFATTEEQTALGPRLNMSGK